MAPTEQETLAERLDRYPLERYPVQHAPTQFHLGSALLHAGDTGPALDALTVACRVFGLAGMRLEAAKATVMLGVGLRAAGRLEEAAASFTAAGDTLAALDQPVEQAAAAYDLGLVLEDLRDADGAHVAFPALGNYLRAAGPDRCVVVTDAIAPASLGPGRYTLGRWDLVIGPDLGARAPDGSHLIGAVVTMRQSVANLVERVGLSREEALRLTVTNPRRALEPAA